MSSQLYWSAQPLFVYQAIYIYTIFSVDVLAATVAFIGTVSVLPLDQIKYGFLERICSV